MNPSLFKARTAAGAIAPYRFVKHGAADNQVAQAAGATDKLCGVVQQLGAAKAGDTVDIAKGGIVGIELGGPVTRGDPLTSDASGKAVVAAPAAGASVRIGGFAEVSGIAGDIIDMEYAPGVMQG